MASMFCRAPFVGQLLRSSQFRFAGVPLRSFAAAAGRRPKIEDGTLEGRYATALFVATSDKLDKVYTDLSGLKAMMETSKEFKLMVETPGIQPEAKVLAITDIAAKAEID